MKNWELGFKGCIMDGRLHGGWHIDKNVAIHEMMDEIFEKESHTMDEKLWNTSQHTFFFKWKKTNE